MTLSLVAILALALGDPSELTGGGLVWSFDAGFSLPNAALGDRGGQVFTLAPTRGLELYSAFDSNPPLPVWEAPFPHNLHGIRAARDSDVYLHGESDVTPMVVAARLRKFTSRSAIPDWTYEFEEQQMLLELPYDLSRDGRVIVSSLFNFSTVRVEIRIHDPATGIPRRQFDLPATWPDRLQLSPDGSVAAIGDRSFMSGSTALIDLETQSVVAWKRGNLPPRQGISEEGRFFVVRQWKGDDGWCVRVFERQEGGYPAVLTVTSPVDVVPVSMALSDDGSTMAAFWSDQGPPEQFIVRGFDVSSGQMTMERILPAWGFGNIDRNIAISADGSRFVVGRSGDGGALGAELAVYSSTSDQPLAEYPAGESVIEVDIAPDGDRFVAVRERTNEGGPGSHPADVEMYELGGEDFVVRGRPSVGETITFELHGPVGSHARLMRSFSLASTPIVFGGVGTLHLDPASISSIPMGVVQPSGVATLSTTATTVPGMIGRTVWFQGLTADPRTLSRDFVQLTIVP